MNLLDNLHAYNRLTKGMKIDKSVKISSHLIKTKCVKLIDSAGKDKLMHFHDIEKLKTIVDKLRTIDSVKNLLCRLQENNSDELDRMIKMNRNDYVKTLQ